MPIIYRNEKGDLVKKGSNGCTDCGLPGTNEKVLDESVEESIVSNTKAESKNKASTKKEVINDDD